MACSSAIRTEAGLTIKTLALEARPPGVVTVITPFPALLGTTNVIVVGETMTNDAAGTPPTVTELAPMRFAPWMVTVEPDRAVVGEKLVIVGAGGRTVNVVRPLVAVPPGVVILITPDCAPFGMTNVIVVGETMVKEDAATPPTVTEFAPVKFAPIMEIVAPGAAEVGEKLMMVGAGGRTVKVVRPLVTVPPGVVMLITPVLAPLGTVMLTVPSRFTVKVAATPPMLTLLAPVRFVPVTVMTVPAAPEAGEKLVMVGAGVVTVNLSEALADPADEVSVTAPVMALFGTVKDIDVWLPSAVVICVAAAPPTVTCVTQCNPRPVTVTTVSGGPDVGVKLVMSSVAGVNTKPASRAVPALVVTTTSPEALLQATVAVICVSLSMVNAATGVPPILTALVPVNRIPVITMLAPGLVCVGVIERIEGWANADVNAVQKTQRVKNTKEIQMRGRSARFMAWVHLGRKINELRIN